MMLHTVPGGESCHVFGRASPRPPTLEQHRWQAEQQQGLLREERAIYCQAAVRRRTLRGPAAWSSGRQICARQGNTRRRPRRTARTCRKSSGKPKLHISAGQAAGRNQERTHCVSLGQPAACLPSSLPNANTHQDKTLTAHAPLLVVALLAVGQVVLFDEVRVERFRAVRAAQASLVPSARQDSPSARSQVLPPRKE